MGDGVFIHITAGPEDPHRALMGLQMAQMMSENHDVLVYCDLQGVNLLSKSSMDVIHSSFPSSHTQIQLLLGKGVPILACPGCLKAAGLRSGDLREGVEVARKDAFFNFTQGRILSLDY
ncbi:DsrE family protein [bacterium]|nr:DsrE family protein [bacterium]